MKEQPYSSQTLNDAIVQHAGAQFSFLSRMRPNENIGGENQEILDTRESTDPTELSELHADKFFGKKFIEVPKKKEKENFCAKKKSSTKKVANYLQRNPQTPEVVSKLQRKTELNKRRRTGGLSTNEKKND